MLGHTILFAGNFAPRGWALCDGSLLSISGYPRLFAILGNTYGGDGRTNFALPDLRGRAVVGAGQGFSPYDLNDRGGREAVTLQVKNLPAHRHALSLTIDTTGGSAANSNTPANGVYATNINQPLFETPANTFMAPYTGSIITANAGSTDPQPVPVLHPVLALNYIICTQEY